MPFASLSDLKKKEEDDSKAPEFYAGGEKSGLAIQNPDDAWKRMQEQAQAGAASGPLPAGAREVTVYRNGFTVNGGTFRPSSDPLNKKFMDEMAAGRCPAELQEGATEPVHVAVQDKRGEDYKAPSAAGAPKGPEKFAGEGQSLSGTSSSSGVAVTVDKGTVEVQEGKPKTKVQIRFHDGSRKAQEFNEDHTVGDLRSFCSQCTGGKAMTIMGGFPPKPLSDDGITLKDAGLCGAAVTARPA
jgi:UBX domain-containing protein 1